MEVRSTKWITHSSFLKDGLLQWEGLGIFCNHHRYVQTLHFFRFNFQLYADDDVVLLIGLVFQALGLGLGKIMFRMIIPDFIWLFASCPWL